MDNLKVHLQTLAQLAMSDKKFHDQEKNLIFNIGKAHNIPEREIEALINEAIQNKDDSEISFTSLTFDERFEYLYNIVQLMKIDSEVFLSEIRYCEKMAVKLGFDKGVVKKMSSKIYSDPAITSDRELLKKEVKSYEL